jgi:hypothetical protein
MKKRFRNIMSLAGSIVMITILTVSLATAAPPDQKIPGQQLPATVTPVVKTPPDLIITKIDFVVVKDTTWGSGTPCKIFNLTPTVANVGNTNAGAFTVLIERNKGAGGAFELACPTCIYSLSGLAKGESKTLEARQFNNCISENWNSFRVTADPTNTVHELNKNNNSMTRSFPF